MYASKHTIIVLDCNKDIIREVLIQAQQIGMMSEDYYYMLTSIDAHTVDLHNFKVKNQVKLTHLNCEILTVELDLHCGFNWRRPWSTYTKKDNIIYQ